MSHMERSIIWSMKVWRIIGAIFWLPMTFFVVGYLEIFGNDKDLPGKTR